MIERRWVAGCDECQDEAEATSVRWASKSDYLDERADLGWRTRRGAHPRLSERPGWVNGLLCPTCAEGVR